MTALRSLAFNLFYVGWTVLLGIPGIPMLFISTRAGWWISGVWVKGLMGALRLCCGIRHHIEGADHLHQGPVIIACKHQSAWETLIFRLLLAKPAYVIKKELLRIPIFGQFMWKLGMVAIDRRQGDLALDHIRHQAKRVLDEGRSIIIFPEGTRRAYGAAPKYKKRGLMTLYEALEIPIVPVALNSGKFWGRNAFHKHPGVIQMQCLTPIPAGLPPEQAVEQTIHAIEQGVNSLASDSNR